MKWITMVVSVLLLGVAGAWYQGLLAGFYAVYPERVPAETFRQDGKPMVIAHRGDSLRYPENTLPAFRAALDRGVQYVEIDVRLTADNVPVVLHDLTVDRTTNGEGPVGGYSFKDLRQLDAGGWFASEFIGTPIPTLEEVLQVAKGRACVIVDLKAVPNRELVAMLRSFSDDGGEYCLFIGMYESAEAASYYQSIGVDEAAMRMLEAADSKKAAKGAAQMQVFKRYWPGVPVIKKIRPDDDIQQKLIDSPGLLAAEVGWRTITPDLSHALHEAGLFVFVIVPTREDEMRSLLNIEKIYTRLNDAGVDAIFIRDLDSFDAFFSSSEVVQSESSIKME